MASRLDRLILLLDTGATPSVRLTAARQLGAIANVRVSHPSARPTAADALPEPETDTLWRGVEGEWAEVIALVARVLPQLASRSYETRLMAAAALAHISRAVGVWDPSGTAPALHELDLDVKPSLPASATLMLSAFSLSKILREGVLLLSSSGAEYARLSNLSSDELASAQKEALAKLGLGGDVGGEIGIDMGAELAAGVDGGEDVKPSLPLDGALPKRELDLPPTLDSEKVSLKILPPPPLASTSTLTPVPATPVDEDDPYSGLSAREKNKLKRKRKSEAKSGIPSSTSFSSGASRPFSAPPALKEEGQGDTKKSKANTGKAKGKSVALEVPDTPTTGTGLDGETVIVDPGAKAREREEARGGGEVQVDLSVKERPELEVREGEWPWRGTVEKLSVGLLSPKWEIRHGAALGLKEVLKLQGGGGGQMVGATVESNAEGHQKWCDDLATKLLCVFALDRFGDYVSDQVVAPVRETAAQALATLMPQMPTRSIQEVQRILVDMIEQEGAPPSLGLEASKLSAMVRTGASKHDVVVDEARGKYVWQVRHAGLLGLKYLVAVKGDLLRSGTTGAVKLEQDGDVKMGAQTEAAVGSSLLKGVVDAALLGLRDRDDDVRSAAAATLTPIADALVEQLPKELVALIDILWECLADLKDDLSSSIGGVMDLLAKLLKYPVVLAMMQSPAIRRPLSDLIPLLFPFFRHTIPTVRLAVLNTILVFLALPSISHSWADSRLLRLLFQNLVVEDRLDVRNATAQAWDKCLALGDEKKLVQDAQPFVENWWSILMSPIGFAMDPSLFWSAKVSLSGQKGFVHNVDKAILAQDLSLVSVEAIMRGRVAGAIAFGNLISTWPLTTHDSTFGKALLEGLASESALRKFLSATVVEEWATASSAAAAKSATPAPSLIQTSTLASRLSQKLLLMIAGEPSPTYSELSIALQRIQVDCHALYSAFESQGKVPSSKVPQLSAGSFSSIQANQAISGFDALIPLMGKGTNKTVLPALEERKKKLVVAMSYHDATKATHDRQVFAALGGAVVALRVIPAKVTPIIRSITTSIKVEEDVNLQARSASAIATFIDICSSPASTLRTNPSDKIVKNLCTFLCQDVSRTPIFATSKSTSTGIFSLEFKPARGLAVKETKESLRVSDEAVAAKLVFRGAQLALSELADRFGENLLERVPKLWGCMSDALLTTFASGDVAIADGILADDLVGQDLLDCLTVLPIAAEKLGVSLQVRITTLFPALCLATRSRIAVVRYATARCFAALCNIVPIVGLRQIVEQVIPVLGDPLNVDLRRGAIELISHIVELLDIKILPYVIFLVVPVLGRMSDSDDEVRLVATNTFATLVKLVPLEAGLPDPPGFSAELLEKRVTERQFLAQLLDGKKVEEYKIPIKIEIELRKYQRDGVSWLAFLAKYQLHGLLCDDMGLGKTLQSICILASKHHERAERHQLTKSPDSVHLPSLIVCPPTLTGHWLQEIKTYAKNLRPVIYTGAKHERERLVASIGRYDAVITSYDIVRNDIEALGKVDWNYCILDEGHIIKNGKTKLTKAVKQIKAIHRLILSGTPIQNNVLELWSLFDFLMPGFLGSEKAFNDRFGKPIAASRDAKSSSKEQASGALALEALHKQVLPFLLRRLKEDVLDDLPPKIIQDYYCELSPLQKQLYDDFSNSQARSQVDDQVSGGQAKGQHIFQALQYLRKLVNHPVLIIKPDLPQHQAIVGKVEASGGSMRDIAHAPKLTALRQILLDCGIGTPASEVDTAIDTVSQHRVLIFCQLKQMLDLIEKDLFKPHMPTVTYMRMDGTTDPSKRHGVVQTFNADPSIDCLLLTTHVGGLGLNLTGADTVIFIEHDWNPMKDLQAMDRAHRLGQKKVVNVYRLIMRGTLEEKIMGLQRFKLNIASSVVTQQNSDLSSLGTDQILDLFNVSSSDAPPVAAKTSNAPMGQKALLDGLGDLPDEEEYAELDLSSFTSSLGA